MRSGMIDEDTLDEAIQVYARALNLQEPPQYAMADHVAERLHGCVCMGVWDDGLIGVLALRGHRIEFIGTIEHGKGAGSALLDEAKRAYRVVHAKVHLGDARAVRFYERNGFVKTGEVFVEAGLHMCLFVWSRR